ncbi:MULTISPECIES: nucleotide exchange factor GrpE [Helicobacter]|uniref:nucleotide exchange factor GrpE n=1 Tax=Helicobacter TaxID=209 RepID=UPI000CF0F4E8|nr:MULTISPECIES: nucleotide exchange factor GrpE [Helicobacter]MDY5950786.1 nucleotide exchange factor GrpE [Helicobacter sp.]
MDKNEEVSNDLESTQTDDEADTLESTEDSEEIAKFEQDESLLEQKIKDLQDQYLRTHADFENVKKRLEKEKAQALEYANQNILKDLLPIIDTLEKALESANALPSGDKIAEGLNLVLGNFSKVLGKHGVEAINTEDGFDPNLHEAIMQVKDDEKEDGAIKQVLQKGYKYKERTLRPAMVSIVKN